MSFDQVKLNNFRLEVRTMGSNTLKQVSKKNLRLALLKEDAQIKDAEDAKSSKLGLLESGGLRKRLAAWSANRLSQKVK